MATWNTYTYHPNKNGGFFHLRRNTPPKFPVRNTLQILHNLKIPPKITQEKLHVPNFSASLSFTAALDCTHSPVVFETKIVRFG